MGAGKEVRQQTARVLDCRSMSALTEEVEPTRKRSLLDATSHGMTKDVTSYGTLIPSTSKKACKTPDEDGVRLGFLIPVDSYKPDEITEESSPIDGGKLFSVLIIMKIHMYNKEKFS
uniref:Uncharacterized protein n=1 Tax=Glossina austeni TaxID=7395 RepID=A0A1A9VAJ8_GLOAU